MAPETPSLRLDRASHGPASRAVLLRRALVGRSFSSAGDHYGPCGGRAGPGPEKTRDPRPPPPEQACFLLCVCSAVRRSRHKSTRWASAAAAARLSSSPPNSCRFSGLHHPSPPPPPPRLVCCTARSAREGVAADRPPYSPPSLPRPACEGAKRGLRRRMHRPAAGAAGEARVFGGLVARCPRLPARTQGA